MSNARNLARVLVDSSGDIAAVNLDNAFIPFDPANVCHQEYLAWLAKGNQPAPADE